ncbi:MAG: HAD-IA family hydrolase [Bacteroidota bacterium]
MTFIFDFDGTIANTLDLILDIYNERITREFGCKFFDKSRLEEFRQKRPASFLRTFGVTPLKLPFIIYRVKTLLKQRMQEVQPHEGMRSLLEQLEAQTIEMGIVTSNSESNVNLFLEQHGMQQYFRFIRSSRSLTSKKRSLNKVIAKYQLDRAKILYIGDEIRDIRSSRAAKIRCAAVTWGHQNGKLLATQHPDVLIKHPSELLSWIQIQKNGAEVG